MNDGNGALIATIISKEIFSLKQPREKEKLLESLQMVEVKEIK